MWTDIKFWLAKQFAEILFGVAFVGVAIVAAVIIEWRMGIKRTRKEPQR